MDLIRELTKLQYGINPPPQKPQMIEFSQPPTHILTWMKSVKSANSLLLAQFSKAFPINKRKVHVHIRFTCGNDALYIKYYAYVIAWPLRPNYFIFTTIVILLFNYVYPNPPCQFSPWKETEAHAEKTHDFRQRWLTLFTIMSL
jgi:hypothetical protein